MLLVMPVRMTNRLLFNFFIDDNALFVVGRGKISAAFKLACATTCLILFTFSQQKFYKLERSRNEKAHLLGVDLDAKKALLNYRGTNYKERSNEKFDL
jgi:hypothetical protein